MPAAFIWFDLNTTDPERARGFYTGLFGWPVGDGAGGYRAWIGDGDQPWAGILQTDQTDQTDQATAGWLPYVVVEDLAEATERAVSLGATVVADATEGPAGTAVTITDPTGARLALFTPRSTR